MKLFNDFGVSALFGTLILIGVFIVIGIGVGQGEIEWDVLLPMFGAWVGAIIASYFGTKNVKEVIKKLIDIQNKNKGES